MTVDGLPPKLAPAMRMRLAAPQLLRPCVRALAGAGGLTTIRRQAQCGSAAASGTLEARVASNLVHLLLMDRADGGDGILAAPGALTEYVAGVPSASILTLAFSPPSAYSAVLLSVGHTIGPLLACGVYMRWSVPRSRFHPAVPEWQRTAGLSPGSEYGTHASWVLMDRLSLGRPQVRGGVARVAPAGAGVRRGDGDDGGDGESVDQSCASGRCAGGGGLRGVCQ